MLCPQLPCFLLNRPGGFWSHPDPKHLIKSRKQQVTLRCSPESGHYSVYRYQQALGQGPSSSFSISSECERGSEPIKLMLRSAVQ